MSLARILVLFLNLVSLGAILFTGVLVAAPFLIPPALELQGTAAETMPPGCFSVTFILLFVPLSLLPALAGWMIRERVVRPQEIAERLWAEAAPLREERLRVWTGFVTDLLLWEEDRKESANDSVSARLRSEIPRALQELDSGRKQRLFIFLGETGLGELARGDLAGRGAGLPDAGSGLGTRRLSRGLVRIAVTGLSLVSGFFLLWAGLIILTLATANPFHMVGVDYGPAQYVLGLSFPLIVALVCGLGAVGLFRESRQDVETWNPGEASRAALGALVLRGALDQIALLENWRKEETLSLVRRIGRAVVLTAVPELGGEERGQLLLALFRGGWITGEGAVSLDRADFRAAELAGARLPRARLAKADLSGADLSEADLEEADLRGCGLCGSNLRSCRLAGADLREADLRAAHVQSAFLEGADLRGAFLDGANFWGAELAKADLSGTHGTMESLAPAGNVGGRRGEMKPVAGSVEAREREARRANLDLRAEILTILLFLPGLGLLVTMIVLLNTIVVMKILPEEAASLGPDLVPNFALGPGPVAVVVLVFLIPAGICMSAGVVLRRFLLRD